MIALSQLRRFVAPLRSAVRLMLARGLLRNVNDTAALQQLQIECLRGEVRGLLEHFQQYGLASHPLPGAEALVGFLGGNRDHGVVFSVADRRFRLKGLEAGEVALYTDEGDRIHFKRGGTIEVRAASQVLVQAPSMVLEGDLQVGGSLTVQSSAMVLGQATVLGPLLGQSTITAGAEIVAGSLGAPLGLLAFRSIYNSHVHGLSPTPTPTA